MIDFVGLPGPFAPMSSAVTVGTFDGVHRGHQEILKELLRVARSRGERSVLVTFDPHPLKIVRPENAPRLLTTRSEKEALLNDWEVDAIAFVPFRTELAQYDPARFVREILVEHFGLAHLVIGYDHGFGRGRTGDVATLKQIGAEMGFEVDVIEPFQVDRKNVSSSGIRSCVQEGDVAAAAAGLGRPFSLIGTVVRGAGRGGPDLGMPTANVEVSDADKLIPPAGIYAVRTGTGKKKGSGVMHIGPRPTFESAKATLEVHLFDFFGDLYGKSLRVEFVERIRGIEKFDSAEALGAAMQADGIAARRILEAVRQK